MRIIIKGSSPLHDYAAPNARSGVNGNLPRPGAKRDDILLAGEIAPGEVIRRLSRNTALGPDGLS